MLRVGPRVRDDVDVVVALRVLLRVTDDVRVADLVWDDVRESLGVLVALRVAVRVEIGDRVSVALYVRV